MLVVLAMHRPAFAQSSEGAFSEKLKAPFATKSVWFADLDQAKAEAKKGDKRIFAYFSKEG